LVKAYDEGQKLARTKRSVEHALKKGFPESREKAVLEEQARVAALEKVNV